MPVRASRRVAFRPAIVATAIVLLAMLGGCGTPPPDPASLRVVGEGDIQTDIRDLGSFSRVSVDAPIKVVIGNGDTNSVSLDAQANLLPLIRTEVVDGQLIVTIPEPGITSTQPISLSLRVPAITSIALSRGAQGYLEHADSPLTLHVSGGSIMTAIGTTPALTLTATAKGKAMLAELVVQDATIDINDGSSAELSVTGSLSGVAEGGATVTLTSKPTSVRVETGSGGSIQGD